MNDYYIEPDNRTYTIQKFEMEVDQALEKIEILGKNRKVNIEVNDDNQFRGTLTYMKKYHDCVVTPTIENGKFSLAYDHDKVSDMEILLTIPRNLYNKFVVHNKNATISIAGVNAKVVTLTSSNGAIEFTGCSPDLDIVTSNGEIRCQLTEFSYQTGQLKATTSNGSVNLIMPNRTDIGYRIDTNLSANHHFNFSSEFEFQTIDQQNHQITYQSKNYDIANQTYDVHVITSNGYVTLK